MMNATRYKAVSLLLLFLAMVMAGACSSDTSSLDITESDRQSIETRLKELHPKELTSMLRDTVGRATISKVVASRLLASSMRHASRFTDAIAQCHTTYSLAVEVGDTIEMTKALNDLATNFRRIGSLGDATEWHYRALQLSEEFSDKESYTARKNKTIAYNGIGNIDLTLKYYEEARNYFAQALEVETSLGSHLGQAINYANIGSIYIYEGRLDSAFVYYTRSMAHNQLANSVVGISLCHNAIGEIYEKREELDSARMEYKASYDLLYKDPDRWHWLVSCLSLGRVEMMLGRRESAYSLLMEAYKVSIEIDAPEQAETACALLSQYEQARDNDEQALDYLIQARGFSDKVQNDRQNNSFLNTRVNYEREKGAKEIQKIAEEREREEKMHRLIVIGISIFAALLVIIIIQYIQTLRMQKARNEELKKMNDTKDKLFSVISHDLKNPAIALRNALHLLSENGDKFPSELLKSTYVDLHKSAVAQVDLLNNLLNWTRLQMGRMQFEPTKMDICGVVTDVSEALRLQAAAKNVSFSLPKVSGMMVFADNNMVSTIVRNIVSNAIKYSYEGSEITFGYQETDKNVILSIQDKGAGMTAERLKEVFSDGHTHSMQGTKGEQGSGLGLALCLDMAKVNNGKIEATSVVKEGTTFKLTLPRC